MKVAFCHYYGLSFGGGGERFLVEAATWLAERGHDVSIYSVPFRRGTWNPTLRGFHYREAPIHFFSAGVTYFMYNPLVSHLFRHQSPRIAGIHSPLLTGSLSGPEYASGSFADDVRNHGPLAAFMKHSSQTFRNKELSSFDAVHWTGAAVPTAFTHRRLFLIPGWVNTRTFYPRADKNKEFTVLFVGRHDHGKGFDRYLELSETLRNLRFISTGEGIRKVEGVGHPSDEDLSTLYSSSSVLVCPSRGDTVGRVLLESLACGTPVLTTSIPAHTSLGLPLLLADDMKGMVNALETLYHMWKADSDRYQQLVTEGSDAVRRYDIDNVLPKFEKMLTLVSGCN